MTMREDIRWQKGGTAQLVSLSIDAITLSSTIPSPPGSRIDGTLTSDPTKPVRVKIHGSKKQPDGTFVLVGRPIDLEKELREELALLARGADSNEREQNEGNR